MRDRFDQNSEANNGNTKILSSQVVDQQQGVNKGFYDK
jgi:hypothetical protein